MKAKQPGLAEVLPTHTPALFDAAVRRAAGLLCQGELVALPTETVYGLAANALDASAVKRIYGVKDRPVHNPIIVHVASLEMARRCVAVWPAPAKKLASAFCPGPLTLVLPRAQAIPDVVSAAGATVGVRWPSHPFILAVIRACGFPLAAPSANVANRASPTTAEHVLKDLGRRIRLIVDGGPCRVGIESTVLDLTTAPPRVLRPGMIHEESLAAVIGEVQNPKAATRSPDPAPRSPGLMKKHYAPKAKLVVLRWREADDLNAQISRLRFDNRRTHIIAHTRIPSGRQFGRISVVPRDASGFARALYAELHRSDDAGAKLIVVEAVPDTPPWRAIADRLRRAAAQ